MHADIVDDAERDVVAAALRTTGHVGPAIDLLRKAIADAAARGLAIHRYGTNGNARNGGTWIRTYAANPAGKPRPRLSRDCEGPWISVNREAAGTGSHFYRQLKWLHTEILEQPVLVTTRGGRP